MEPCPPGHRAHLTLRARRGSPNPLTPAPGQGLDAACRFTHMRRLAALSFVLAAGLAVSACGHTPVAAPDRVPVLPTPLISTAPTTSPGTAVAVAWTPEVAAQIQAAQLEAAEEQYAACFAYAGLDQSLAGTFPAARHARRRVLLDCRSHAGRGAGDPEPDPPSVVSPAFCPVLHS